MSRCQTCYETDDPNGYCACSRKAAADDWAISEPPVSQRSEGEPPPRTPPEKVAAVAAMIVKSQAYVAAGGKMYSLTEARAYIRSRRP